MSLIGALVSLREQTHKTQILLVKEDANPSTIDLIQRMENDLDIVITRINTREAERQAHLNQGGWRGGR